MGGGAPFPGVCEPFYPWALMLPASFFQRSSWPKPMWAAVTCADCYRTLLCLHPALKVTKLQDVSWEGDIQLIKSTFHPNSLVQIGKLKPSRQDLPKVTLSATEPREAEPPRSRLADLSREEPDEAGPKSGITTPKITAGQDRPSREQTGRLTPRAGRQDPPMRSQGRRGGYFRSG